MKRFVPVCLTMLLLLNGVHAQEELEKAPFVASVHQLKGICYIREGQAGKPRKLKLNEQLRAEQELSCEKGSHLSIVFHGSSNEKEIKKILPNWYVLPNIPSPDEGLTKLKLAGRPKNGMDRINQLGMPDGGGQNAVAAVRKPLSGTGIDEADLFWKSRNKYFLIVAASKTAGLNTDLPFTKIDARLLSQTLINNGYEKLDILDEEQATHDNFINRLKGIRTLPENAVVVVYYSGHAVKDPQDKDLWLQLYGQANYGDHYGLSLSELIGAARGDSYKGDLVIILDSCYSGQATVSSQLSLRETNKTVIFASSASYEPSYSVKLTSGTEMSAFTYYLLRGLGPDWSEVDGDSDGIILYSDLQTYIENKLLELVRDQLIPVSMQPQLFGQSPKIWTAYNSRLARNRESQVRRTLRLERSFRVQDPEKTLDLLREAEPANADSYLKALVEIRKKQFDDAWRLLDVAEDEKGVPQAQIWWARGYLKAEQGQIGSARDWLEKSLVTIGQQHLSITPEDNIDLVITIASLNVSLGDFIKAQQYFKQDLVLIGNGKSYNDELVASLFALTFLNLIQGNKAEAEPYLARLRTTDPKTWEELGGGSNTLIIFLEVLSDILEDKLDSAQRKFEDLRKSVSSVDEEMQNLPSSFTQMLASILSAHGGNRGTSLAERLDGWDKALKQRNVNEIVILLNGLAAANSDLSGADSPLRSQEIDSLLKRTVELAREHKSGKEKRANGSQAQANNTELTNNQDEETLKGASLLAVVATIYADKNDSAQAEELFKEAISLEVKQPADVVQALNPVLRLGRMYVDERRFNDAEELYKTFLRKVRESLGEQNFYSYITHERLGETYEDWERWDEAEQSYRTALLTQSENDGMFFSEGIEKLANFLYNRGRYAEALPLLEQATQRRKQEQNAGSLLSDDSLGSNYFRLAQTYYQLSRYGAADKAFRGAFEIFSAKDNPDLLDILSCLAWQWFTADSLKQHDEANRFFQKLIKLTESDLARPHPNEFLGTNLQTFASWFINGKAFPEAEQLLKLALTTQEKVYGPKSVQVAEVWESFAHLSNARTQYGDSITFLDKAYKIYENQTPPDFEKLANLLYWLGLAKYERQDFEAAHADLQHALDTLQQIPQLSRPHDTDTELLLSEVQRLLGHYDAANKNLRSMLNLLEREQGNATTFSDLLANVLLELATISRFQGNREEAKRWLQRAQTELNKPSGAQCIFCLAMLAHEKGMLTILGGNTELGEQLLRESVDKGEQIQMPPLLLAEYLEDYAAVLHQRKKDEAIQVQSRARQIREALKNPN